MGGGSSALPPQSEWVSGRSDLLNCLFRQT